LLAGLKALKPGGRLVYTTSSIINAENDEVVTAAVKQSGGEVSVVAVQDWDLLGVDELLHLAGADPTKHGVIILPDKSVWGPIYVALLQKAAV
jgi:16S rRNA C967 or C1407 C5-methylase (RsmB/RsmF family)